MSEPQGWRPMSEAPQDGTVVELENRSGPAPYYDIHRWANGRWQHAKHDNMWIESAALRWRPYHGSVENYVDPTNGRQLTADYYLEALGRPPRRAPRPSATILTNSGPRRGPRPYDILFGALLVTTIIMGALFLLA